MRIYEISRPIEVHFSCGTLIKGGEFVKVMKRTFQKKSSLNVSGLSRNGPLCLNNHVGAIRWTEGRITGGGGGGLKTCKQQ